MAQPQLVKKLGSERYEIVRIPDPVSFDQGFSLVIRACQLLAQKNSGILFVGVAGPSGAGKTVFTDRIFHFLPDIAIITMDNYFDSSRVIDKNFDDPRWIDYDTLLDNLRGLKQGKAVEVPIYCFKTSSRIGSSKIEVPASRIVIIEGIFALSDKLQQLLNLRVAVTGGVHSDLVKRILRDTDRAGREPAETIMQISETVFPMFKAFIEPDLNTAHITIRNQFNAFSTIESKTYTLKVVQGTQSTYVNCIAVQLGLDGCYDTRTYVEMVTSKKLADDVMVAIDDLKLKLGLNDNDVSGLKSAVSRSSPSRGLIRAIPEPCPDERVNELPANQEVLAQLLDQTSTLNHTMTKLTGHVEEIALTVRQAQKDGMIWPLQGCFFSP